MPFRSMIWPRAGSSGRVRLIASAGYREDSKPCSWSNRPAHRERPMAMAIKTMCSRCGEGASAMRTAVRRRRGRTRLGELVGRPLAGWPLVGRPLPDWGPRVARPCRPAGSSSRGRAGSGSCRPWPAGPVSGAADGRAVVPAEVERGGRRSLAIRQPPGRCAFFFAFLAAAFFSVRLLLRGALLRLRRLLGGGLRLGRLLLGDLLGGRGLLLRQLGGPFRRDLRRGLDDQAGHLGPGHRHRLADHLALRQHQERRMGIGPHAQRRRAPGQLGRRRLGVQPVLQIGLDVGQLGGLPVQGARLERLILQGGVQHQQARHAQPEDADQHQQEREAGEPRGRPGRPPAAGGARAGLLG